MFPRCVFERVILGDVRISESLLSWTALKKPTNAELFKMAKSTARPFVIAIGVLLIDTSSLKNFEKFVPMSCMNSSETEIKRVSMLT